MKLIWMLLFVFIKRDANCKTHFVWNYINYMQHAIPRSVINEDNAE